MGFGLHTVGASPVAELGVCSAGPAAVALRLGFRVARGIFLDQDRTRVSCTGRQIL